VTSARLALDLGLPIYGVVAMTATAMDKAGKSIPAPGRGILSTAREVPTEMHTGLNIERRRKSLHFKMSQVKQWEDYEMSVIQQEAELFDDVNKREEFLKLRGEKCKQEAQRQIERAKASIGNLLDGDEDPHVSPMRRSLAAFNLGIDDIDAISFHGTSTVANEKNESATHDASLKHLGRAPGHVAFVICQKNLTGHPKGGAAAWMLNGAIQSMLSGRIPGNHNLDNVGAELQKFNHLLYLSSPIQLDRPLNAVLITSFGFGQAGAEIMIVHPNRVFSCVSESAYKLYVEKNVIRQQNAQKIFSRALIKNDIVKIKDTPPYAPEIEMDVLLHPLARVTKDEKKGNLEFSKKQMSKLTDDLQKVTHAMNNSIGCDVEIVELFPHDNDIFVNRNFTLQEIEYCRAAASPQESFAGKWAAKEAVFKTIGVKGNTSDSMREIEIISTATGPVTQLYGRALQMANANNIKSIKVSISHSTDHRGRGIAVATAIVEDSSKI